MSIDSSNCFEFHNEQDWIDCDNSIGEFKISMIKRTMSPDLTIDDYIYD